MTARVPVLAGLPAYRVAVAGLPMRAEPAMDRSGAVVVVDGATPWWDAAQRALDDGAAALLVAEPRDVPLEAVRRLVATAEAPIVVHRARLRADLVERALGQREHRAPRIVVAECRADARDLASMVRDAVGWVRSFAGGPPAVASASAASDGGSALLRSADDRRVVGSLIASLTTPAGATLRVQALGEATTELEIDEPAGRSELSTSTARGRLVAPARHEAGERVALRRAIEVLAGGSGSRDLADLLNDEEAASAILRLEAGRRIFS